MAVTFDAKAAGDNGPGFNSTTATWNHTVSGSNTVLQVAVNGDTADTLTGVTFNGVAMTLVAKKQDNDRFNYLFIQIAPATGTHAVLVTNSVNASLSGESVSLNGARQTNQPEAFATTSISGGGQTSMTLGVSTLTDGCWLVAAASWEQGGIGAGTNTFFRQAAATGTGSGYFDSNLSLSPPGFWSLQVTGSALGGGVGAAMIVAAIAPVPNAGTTVDFLVVGGGGGGGVGVGAPAQAGGGGGAGGYIRGITQVTPGTYTITIGNGGSGSTNTSGSDSSALGFTATGGGHGGVIDGAAGGSGGGGSTNGGTSGTGGAGSAGMGNNGSAAAAQNSAADAGGAGGGAGAVGGTASANNGGAGGVGMTTTISGSSTTYAGGGGGGVRGATGNGAGGSGGGGAGATSAGVGVAGTPNTGGGGGGAGAANGAGNGGSGIGIISYTTGSLFASGGTITTSGGNTIHTFVTSGSWIVFTNSPLYVRSLMGVGK